MESQPPPENSQVEPSSALVPTKKSKVRRNVLIAGSAVGLIGIGSTLASNITINAGESVEFGQGVAETTTCDTDISINPVTSYDTENSIFRLDYVEVSNLDLTPVGTGFSEGGYDTQAEAQAARPGEYYDTAASAWKRTCDGVVLDFKAYTDDTNYWTSTREGYANDTINDISTPVGWSQYDGNPNQSTNSNIYNFGFAVVFDTNDDNSGVQSNSGMGEDLSGYTYESSTSWEDLVRTDPANSSFKFGALYNFRLDYRPDAASISKITVASMATFPSDYYTYDGIGTNG